MKKFYLLFKTNSDCIIENFVRRNIKLIYLSAARNNKKISKTKICF
jgi:hypothetical protein